MPEWEIIISERLFEELNKLDQNVITWFEKIKEQIRQNPYHGKQLRFRWFREKKLEGMRL